MDTRGRNTWHTTEPWHNSPLPEGVSHAITVPPGRGGGRSGGPSGQTWTGTQDGDLQSGTNDWGNGGAGSSGGHGGAGSSGGHGRWSFMAMAFSLGQATPAGTLLPPQKNSLGKWGLDPRGLSQRRSGGIESEAGRRALSQRRAGGVISREWRAWGSGNPGTREPAGGLGIATAGGEYLPRSAGMRAHGQRTRLPRERKHRNK